MYKDKAKMNFKVVENMVMAFYSPSLLGRERVEKMYENFLSKYQNEEAFPTSWTRGMTNKEKLQERKDRLLGTERNFQLYVVLYTQEKKVDPRKKEDCVSKQEKFPKGAKIK